MFHQEKTIVLSRKTSKRTGTIEKVIPSKDDQVNFCGEIYDFPRGSTRSKKEFRGKKRNLEVKLAVSNKKRKIDSLASIKKQSNKIDVDVGASGRDVKFENTLKLVTRSRQLRVDDPGRLMNFDDMNPDNLPDMSSSQFRLNLEWNIPSFTNLSLAFDPWNILDDLDYLFIDDFQ